MDDRQSVRVKWHARQWATHVWLEGVVSNGVSAMVDNGKVLKGTLANGSGLLLRFMHRTRVLRLRNLYWTLFLAGAGISVTSEPPYGGRHQKSWTPRLPANISDLG